MTPTPKRAAVAVTLLAALAIATVPVGASDPIGIYCVVQKVVLEPDTCAPTRVQIWGAFSFSNPQTGGYTDVMTGYLYYAVPPDTSAAVANHNKVIAAEWLDLKAVAGTNEVVGFAGRRGPLGRVRPATEKPENPDAYPALNTGVVRLQNNMWARATWYTDMAAALKRAAGR
jgi:hypothetical protein